MPPALSQKRATEVILLLGLEKSVRELTREILQPDVREELEHRMGELFTDSLKEAEMFLGRLDVERKKLKDRGINTGT